MRVPPEVRAVLEGADLCHVATITPSGPHATPMVFAVAGDRLWVTTSRGSVKARGWAREPRVAGVVARGREAVAFAGVATTYDVLDPSSWARAIGESPVLALAAARFTRKNARFFAGYAVDAHRVPLAWTPPGRVFADLRCERIALIRDDLVVRTWGRWGTELPSHERFRAARTGEGPLEALPHGVREDLGRNGAGVLAVVGRRGVVALPSSWVASGAGLYAVLPEPVLALADLEGPAAGAALQADRPSGWRARDMVGAMARGRAEVHAAGRLASGGRSAAAIAREAGAEPDRAAIVRIRPEALVWWRGWSGGTVRVRMRVARGLRRVG